MQPISTVGQQNQNRADIFYGWSLIVIEAMAAGSRRDPETDLQLVRLDVAAVVGVVAAPQLKEGC